QEADMVGASSWTNLLAHGPSFRALADSIDACVCVQGPDGRYLLVNPPFCAWLGRAEEELLGQRASSVWPADLAARQQADCARALAGASLDREERLPRAGADRVVRARRLPLRGHDGTILGVLTVFQEAPSPRGRTKDEGARPSSFIPPHSPSRRP